MQTLFRLLLLVIAVTELSGCATLVAPNYSPSYEAIDQVKKVNADRIAVGTVQPTDPEAKVNHISLRAASLKSPNGTFAKYLENALISDLTEMGFYDPSSSTQIDATILRNDIDISGISTGSGVMEANIRITKAGAMVFEKNYIANTKFESSFAGAVAIPKGQSEYSNLVRMLLQQVYTDPAFIQAIKK